LSKVEKQFQPKGGRAFPVPANSKTVQKRLGKKKTVPVNCISTEEGQKSAKHVT